MTAEQAALLESSTMDQAQCKLWHQHHVGRVTALLFKSAVKTNPAMPSQSLIKRICYPQAYKFSTKSTGYMPTVISLLYILN